MFVRSSARIGVRRLPVPAGGDRVAVCWSLRYGLSYRDVEELMVERGVQVDHVTIYPWVRRFTPILAETAAAQAPEVSSHPRHSSDSVVSDSCRR